MPDRLSIFDRNTLAGASPIARLLAECRHVEAEYDAAAKRENAALDRARAKYPKPTPRLAHYLKAGSEAFGGAVNWPIPMHETALVDVERRTRATGSNRDLRDARLLLNDWRAWKMDCDAVDVAEGVSNAQARLEELKQQLEDAEQRLFLAPATTPAAILIKLDYMAEVGGLTDELEEHPNWLIGRVLTRVIRDLKADLQPN